MYRLDKHNTGNYAIYKDKIINSNIVIEFKGSLEHQGDLAIEVLNLLNNKAV